MDEDVHEHEHLAELGELKLLKVIAPDKAIVTLTGFSSGRHKCFLASNEDGTQLYIRGGDQSVDLDQFGIEKPYHDFEDLGQMKQIRYFTTKDHLGNEGGTATYYHVLAEEGGRRPRIVYSTKDQLLQIVGGSYVIEPEGIRN